MYDICGLKYNDNPKSRVERLLKQIHDDGGGGGGTLYPTFTLPSAVISGSGSKLLEKGTTANVTITVSFSRGKIEPDYGTSGYRSGPATGYILNGGSSQPGNTFSQTVSEANKSFKGRVDYSAGEQPKDSKGADYDAPLPAGYVETNTLNYEFVEPLYIDDTANPGEYIKQNLVSKSANEKIIVMPSQTVEHPDAFYLPVGWTYMGVEVLNPLSEKYVDCSSEFTEGDQVTINGINYIRHYDNRGYSADERTIKVKWR